MFEGVHWCCSWEGSHTVPLELTYHILSKMIFRLSEAGYVSFLEGIWWMSQSRIVHWAESINEVRMEKTLTFDVREASKEPFLISLNWLIDDCCQKRFTWLTCVHVHILVESDDERFLYRTGRIGKADSFNEVCCQRGRIQVNSQEQEVRHLKHIIILGAWSY